MTTQSRHYPELVEVPNQYAEFLRAVIGRQARLIAQWQLVGFIHGVMNTDNMAVSGETIDYGPCAFMNSYRPDTVFSSIDRGGRYAYGNQPTIAQWNLARFAETLLPLLDADQERAVAIATDALNGFVGVYQECWLSGMRKKLGLLTEEEGDRELVQSLLDSMQATSADFTNTFRDLSEGTLLFDGYQTASFPNWYNQWQTRVHREGRPVEVVASQMQSVNPALIPRNHRVEEVLNAAEVRVDLAGLHRLVTALSSPFKSGPDSAFYREPSPDDGSYRTFCGT